MNLRTSERWALVQSIGAAVTVHQWDNWYEYPGSYWTAVCRKVSVDQGKGHKVFIFFICCWDSRHLFADADGCYLSGRNDLAVSDRGSNAG